MGFLTEVERKLDIPPGPKAEVMRELASHFEDIREELLASGMPEAQVDQEAERRLGTPRDVAARLSAVHNSASWRSAGLCAVPFVLSAISVWLYTANFGIQIRLAWLSVVFAVTAAASIREMAAGRRPVWLATWLAAALLAANDISIVIHYSVYAHNAGLLVYQRGFIISGLALALLALVAAWRLQPARTPTLVTVVLYSACAIRALAAGPTESSGALPTMVAMSTVPILIIMFARRMFEWHPYSNALQAALFIFSMFALRFLPSKELEYASYLIVGEVLCGLAVLWFARVPVNKNRVLLLAILVLCVATVLAEGPFGGIVRNCQVMDYIGSAISHYWWLWFITFWPVSHKANGQREQNPPAIVT